MDILVYLGDALFMAVSMFWEILWPLISGLYALGDHPGSRVTSKYRQSARR